MGATPCCSVLQKMTTHQDVFLFFRVVDAVGTGKVIVEVGECGYCAGFAGEAVVGEDPLPPFILRVPARLRRLER